MTILLDNVSVDTITAVPFQSRGGVAVVNIRGDNFGGGTITIEAASINDGATPRYVVLPNGTFTSDGTVKLDYLPQGALIQAKLDGSSGASNVFVDILQ